MTGRRALFPVDVLAWVQETQPKAWEILSKNHGAKAEETLLARLRDQIDQRGTLDVLRHGIELLGLKQPLKLAEALDGSKKIVVCTIQTFPLPWRPCGSSPRRRASALP